MKSNNNKIIVRLTGLHRYILHPWITTLQVHLYQTASSTPTLVTRRQNRIHWILQQNSPCQASIWITTYHDQQQHPWQQSQWPWTSARAVVPIFLPWESVRLIDWVTYHLIPDTTHPVDYIFGVWISVPTNCVCQEQSRIEYNLRKCEMQQQILSLFSVPNSN